jgi:hypothetical protein
VKAVEAAQERMEEIDGQMCVRLGTPLVPSCTELD